MKGLEDPDVRGEAGQQESTARRHNRSGILMPGGEYFLTVEIRCAVPDLRRLRSSMDPHLQYLGINSSESDLSPDELLEDALDTSMDALEDSLIRLNVELRSAVITCGRNARFDHSAESESNRVSRHYSFEP
jgi:hypothetical protein